MSARKSKDYGPPAIAQSMRNERTCITIERSPRGVTAPAQIQSMRLREKRVRTHNLNTGDERRSPLACLPLIGGSASSYSLWGIAEAQLELLVEIRQVRITHFKCDIRDALIGAHY